MLGKASCWKCEADLGELRQVDREELCPGCETWVHCCMSCRFWDARARSCEEPAAEWVHDRERANFCDFFALRADEPAPGATRRDDDPPPGGRDAFDALFKQ